MAMATSMRDPCGSWINSLICELMLFRQECAGHCYAAIVHKPRCVENKVWHTNNGVMHVIFRRIPGLHLPTDINGASRNRWDYMAIQKLTADQPSAYVSSA